MHRRRRGGAFALALLHFCVLASLSAACARPKAKAIADVPPLEMPSPPPRDIESNEAEPLPPVPLIQEPAHNAPPRPRPTPPAREQPRPGATAADAPKPEPPKPEPATEESAKPEEPAKPPTLQTTPAEAEGEVERNIRATLARAASDLNRIDYRNLNNDARTQYDTAKRFIQQADEAVRGKNLVFAKSLADKAAALATQLGGR
jgi:outer membrane biosynthesis protein TonB